MGALQVGMLRALLEGGVVPDLVVGCSVGAFNGAAVAEEPTLARVRALEELWLGLDSRDLVPGGLLPTIVHLARRGVSMHGNEAFRAMIGRILTVDTFEELAVSFECVATAIVEAREVWFSEGPLTEAILASAALPTVLPPVEIDGVSYLDGAVVNDVPVSRAVELGARKIFVLHTGAQDRSHPAPRRPFDVALQAYWIGRRARLRRDLAAVPADVEVVILPTGDIPILRFNDLSQSEALMWLAYEATAGVLAERGERPERNAWTGPEPAPAPTVGVEPER